MDWVRSISTRCRSRRFKPKHMGTGMLPRAGRGFRYYPALLPVVGCLISCSGQQTEQSRFLSYLPQGGEVDRWSSSEEPQHAVGEDLFLLINGGAEIYHEYGFEQAAVLS